AVCSVGVMSGGGTRACASVPLTVGLASPSIATGLSPGSVAVGGRAHDTATLSGATAAAGGTVTYTVFTNNTCSTQAPAAQQPVPATVTVTGGLVPDSAAVSFPAAGTFFWQAAYSGDANNNAAASVCASEPTTVGVGGAPLAPALSSGAVAVAGPVHASPTRRCSDLGGGGAAYTVFSKNTSWTPVPAGLQPVPAVVTVTGGVVPDSAAVSFP